MAVVIYSDKDGVFLGVALGLAFWSKLDPVGQTSAATFESETQAEEFMATWDLGRPADARCVPVVPDDGEHASIAACVRAGLPGWNPDEATVTPDAQATTFASSPVNDLSAAAEKLNALGSQFKALELTSVKYGRERDAAIAAGLTAVAAHYGVTLRQGLHIDSRGDYMLVAVRAEQSALPPTYGAFADVLNKYHARTGVPGYTNQLIPSNSWCYLNHFDAEKLILDQAKLLKS